MHRGTPWSLAGTVLALSLCLGSCARVRHVAPPLKGTVLYVAADGSDANPGTRALPFATLERARDAIREMKKAGGLPEGGVTVALRGGVHERATPFELTKADSGTEAAPIVYRAAPGEQVRLTGGRTVTAWKPVTDPQALGRLEPQARGKVLQADLKALGITEYGPVQAGSLELFFNDVPMTLARWPNEGFIHITKLAGTITKSRRGRVMSRDGKLNYEGDRPRRWVGEKDPWAHGYWYIDWAERRYPIASIEPDKQLMVLKPPLKGYGFRQGQWFYGFNLLCEIDQPGEWYLDRETGTLTFWPPSSARRGRAVVSVAPALVTMDDASHVTVRGLVLEAARNDAVVLRGCTRCQVVGCTIRNVGSWAVRVSGGTADQVVGCDITQTGAGGIALSGGDRKTLTPASHVAENNHIHHTSRWHRVYQPGVSLSGVGLRAAHNLIHNAPHMAIGFNGNDHVLEFNEVHSVCYESNDAGAVYSGRDWAKRGTVVRHNYFHHICGFQGRGCVGVYFDDMLSGNHIVGNLFYKVTRAAFVGGGRDCTVANNIFVDCNPSLHVDARGLGKYDYGASTSMPKYLKAVPYQQEPWRSRYPKLVGMLADEPAAPKGNLIARNISVGGKWDGVQGRARPYLTFENNLIDKDPHFAGTPPRSFHLRADSPAWKLGFKPIPIDKIGLYNDDRRASWPVTHAVRPMPERPEPRPRVRKGPPPLVRARRAAAPPTIDGTIEPKEWTAARIELKQDVHGRKAGPPSTAWVAWDDTHLYVAIDNKVGPEKPLPRTNVWGQDDAVEVALRNPAGGKKAPIFVLRGWPNGHLDSSTESGVSAAAATKAGAGTKYAAKVLGKNRWTAEFAVRFTALGIDPKKHRKLQFNLTVRKAAQDLWLMWEGTRGRSWEAHNAGVLALQ